MNGRRYPPCPIDRSGRRAPLFSAHLEGSSPRCIRFKTARPAQVAGRRAVNKRQAITQCHPPGLAAAPSVLSLTRRGGLKGSARVIKTRTAAREKCEQLLHFSRAVGERLPKGAGREFMRAAVTSLILASALLMTAHANAQSRVDVVPSVSL